MEKKDEGRKVKLRYYYSYIKFNEYMGNVSFGFEG